MKWDSWTVCQFGVQLEGGSNVSFTFGYPDTDTISGNFSISQIILQLN